MAEIEDVAGRAAHGLEETGGFAADDLRRGVHEHRVEVALQRDVGRDELAHDAEVGGPVDAQHAGAAEGEVGELRRAALGVDDDWEILGQRGDDLPDPAQRGRLIILAGDDAAPRVEELDRIGAGADLHLAVVDDRGRDLLQERVEQRPVGVEEGLDADVVVRAAALDHVGGERPWRTGEAQQRALALELGFDASQGLADIVESRRDAGGIEAFHLRAGLEFEIHRNAAFLAELVTLAERLGDHEDVGEDDGRIEREAPERLQRDLGGEFRRAHHFEEGVPGLQRAVLRQVAAGLAHDPDGRAVKRCAGGGGEEALVGGHEIRNEELGIKKTDEASGGIWFGRIS